MDVDRLRRWLGSRLRRDANLCLALSPVGLIAGILTLFVTFWFSYAVIWMVAKVLTAIPSLLFDTRWQLNHRGRLWTAGGFLVLLVISYMKSNRHPAELETWDHDPSTLGQSLARFGAGAGRAALLLAYPEMTARIVVDLLFLGPRLFHGGFNLLRESGRSRSADTEAGARVLWTLLGQTQKVSYDDLANLYPAPELTAAFLALRPISGVVFLEAGLSLTTELRQELLRP